MCSPTLKLPKPCPLGDLWRLCYIGTIGEIMGHWLWTQRHLSLPQNWGGTEISNPLNRGLIFLTTLPILRHSPKVSSLA